MNDSSVFSTASTSPDQPKTTGDEVVEFIFNSSTYMVSAHPERGSTLALTLQGLSMVIPVAAIPFVDGTPGDITWETPFSGYPPECLDALIALVLANMSPSLKEAM